MKWRREGLEKEVIDFIKDSTKVNIGIKKAWIIPIGVNKNIAVVEVDSWERWRDITSKKKDLEKDIVTEDDSTRKKGDVQRKLREMARGEREKGIKNVKVGYERIRVEEKWFRWNKREGELREEGRRERWYEKRGEGEEDKETGLKICFWNIAGVTNKCEET